MAVLVVTALAAMVAMSLLYQMRAEASASVAGHSRQQAYAAALAGIQRAVTVLQAAPDDPTQWYDNPDLFRNQAICSDSRGDTWYFTVYAPNPDDPFAVRNGLIDEAGKINLNVASADALARLPGMTPERVDCLLDYLDPDGDARPEGAEQDYYSRLAHPYQIKNGPLATLEELLLVKGFNGPVVYGEDYNLNGLLDRNEDDGDDTFPPDNRDGVLDEGLMGVATVVSYERNVSSTGRARVNINGDVSSLGGAGLPAQTVQFIQAVRADGNFFRHPSDLLGMTYTSRTQRDPSGQPRRISSGVTAANLATVLDRLTTRPGGARVPVVGLVNVNTASKQVLCFVPGIDENLAQQIVDARGVEEAGTSTALPGDGQTAADGSAPAPGGQKSSIAWLVTQNVVEPDKFKEIAPYLTARSFQYRVRCVAFGVPSGRYCTLEAVVDLAQGSPRVLYVRDLTRLGLPLPIQKDQLPPPGQVGR